MTAIPEGLRQQVREAIAGTPELWDQTCHISDAQFNAMTERVVQLLSASQQEVERLRKDALTLADKLADAIIAKNESQQANAAMAKDAESWRRWRAVQKRVEDELPAGFAVELYMSPGDWSLSLTDPAGVDIEIFDWDDTEDFISRAIDRAKAAIEGQPHA